MSVFEYEVSSSLILFTFCAVCCARQRINATEGDNVILPCHTTLAFPVDWKYKHHDTAKEDYIFIGGNGGVYWPHHNRTELMIKDGDYNLVLNNVNVNDTGVYTCIEDEGIGARHGFLLHIYYPDPKSVTSSTTTTTSHVTTNTNILWFAVLALLIAFTTLLGIVAIHLFKRNRERHKLHVQRNQLDDTKQMSVC